MSRCTSFGLVPAILLGLAISAGPALAQKTTLKAKNDKVKAKTTAADGTVSKTKTVAATTAPAAPQPTSPVASAPQVVQPATMAVATAPVEAKAEGITGWISDLGAAQAQAKATNRPILAVFSGSDWCKPCIMYEQEVFAKPEFAAYAKDKLVLAHFDFPRQKRNQPSAAQLKLNEAAAAQLNREGDFPLAVVLSPEGKVLAKTGYIAGGPAAFEAYLKKVVPTL
ncbi:thioredoxin family protein [Hymenobacter convexus]|uniref:thioredoxin family protein n=1 Tax=Hymenobacter sp. CA1UV-4 TaxID=3063782 RepID=UPI0027140F8B|nr:thioredoxin family protein [Hymenobacter sp. CA1UV-4]MDO7852905.1 thioredoxin family protein [Hymenobacter sp. CA1UV-4]